MKNVVLVAGAALAIGIGAANAADVVRPAPVYKTPVAPVPVFTWTGPYVGINGGYGWGDSDVDGLFSSSRSVSGGLVGLTLGYNFQAGSLVYGLEGDMNYSSIDGSSACGATTCEFRNKWLGTVRGRLGYAAGRFMPYITGGGAFGSVENTIVGVGSADSTKFGWTLGAGVEASIAPNWTAKLEYLYVDLGKTAAVAGSSADMRANIVRAGLNYRF